MSNPTDRRVRWVRDSAFDAQLIQPPRRLTNWIIGAGQSGLDAVLGRVRPPSRALPPLQGMILSAGLPGPLRDSGAIDLARFVYGTPRVDSPKNAVDEAIILLETAAAIEHSLMVQYLYAGFAAADQDLGDDINPNSDIRTIAVQEMGH